MRNQSDKTRHRKIFTFSLSAYQSVFFLSSTSPLLLDTDRSSLLILYHKIFSLKYLHNNVVT